MGLKGARLAELNEEVFDGPWGEDDDKEGGDKYIG